MLVLVMVVHHHCRVRIPFKTTLFFFYCVYSTNMEVVVNSVAGLNLSFPSACAEFEDMKDLN